MIVTLVGIVTDVSDVHDSKAPAAIVVTLVGIITDVSPVHPQNVDMPILVVLLAKVMTQGVVVHRLQQSLASLLLHVTYRAH